VAEEVVGVGAEGAATEDAGGVGVGAQQRWVGARRRGTEGRGATASGVERAAAAQSESERVRTEDGTKRYFNVL
jgi:hypothetical protein